MGRVGRLYCCALVLICGTVGTDEGVVYAEISPGLVARPGCRAPGIPLDGCVLENCGVCGVCGALWCMLMFGVSAGEYCKEGDFCDCCCCCCAVYGELCWPCGRADRLADCI